MVHMLLRVLLALVAGTMSDGNDSVGVTGTRSSHRFHTGVGVGGAVEMTTKRMATYRDSEEEEDEALSDIDVV